MQYDEALRDEPLPEEPLPEEPLYDEIGGAPVLKTAVAVFNRRIRADPALAPWFSHIDMERLRSHQYAFLTATLGGPDVFAGRQLVAAHAGLQVNDEAFERLTDHLTGVLRDLGVDPAAIAEVSERLESLRHLVIEAGPGSGGSDDSARAEGERTR